MSFRQPSNGAPNSSSTTVGGRTPGISTWRLGGSSRSAPTSSRSPSLRSPGSSVIPFRGSSSVSREWRRPSLEPGRITGRYSSPGIGRTTSPVDRAFSGNAAKSRYDTGLGRSAGRTGSGGFDSSIGRGTGRGDAAFGRSNLPTSEATLGRYAEDRPRGGLRPAGDGFNSSGKRLGTGNDERVLDGTGRGMPGLDLAPTLAPSVSLRPGTGTSTGSGYWYDGGGYRSGGWGYDRYCGSPCSSWYWCRYPYYSYCYRPWWSWSSWWWDSCSSWYWCDWWPRSCYSYGYWGGYGYYWPYVGSSVTVYVTGGSDVVQAVEDGGAYAEPVDEGPTKADSYAASSPEALARHYSSLGDLYLRTRRYTRAVDSYERAVRLVETDGSLRLVLADALFQVGRIDEAAYQVRKGFGLDPSLRQVRIDKREFYDWPEDFDEALKKLERQVADNPYDTNARLVLAYNYRMTLRMDEARRELAVLADQLPGDGTVALLLRGITELSEAAGAGAPKAPAPEGAPGAPAGKGAETGGQSGR
ncbi:MAG: tetratricopeptide repeat protein [Planctomycetota bacterium]